MRYPGAKTKMAQTLIEHIPLDVTEICEPFAGTLAVSIKLAQRQKLQRLWINDLDEGLVRLWQCIFEQPERLIKEINAYVPDPQDFYDFKANPITGDALQDGFRKLVIQQISYSGMGAKAGSPIGGRNQTGKYKVDCRWNPKRLEKWVNNLNDLFVDTDVTVTNLSWQDTLDTQAFIYFDPPYFLQGAGLYLHGNLDHEALAIALQGKDQWLLSYDDCPEIRNLYDWAQIVDFPVTSHIRHKKSQDLIIKPGVSSEQNQSNL